jgi:hypothetical protein
MGMVINAFQFRQNGDDLELYMNEQRTNVRIYPVKMAEEPVMLSPEGRVVPSTVWYATGSMADDDGTTRSYVTEEAALQGENERIYKWFVSYEEEKNHFVPQKITPVLRGAGRDFFKIVISESEVDTGFTVEKPDHGWNFIYDGIVWGNAETWSDTITVMGHIVFHLGDLLYKGPEALKEFTAQYIWKDRDGAPALFDDDQETGFVIQPGYGGFICSLNGSGSEKVFPTMEEAQIEAKLRYTKEKSAWITG